MEQSTYEGVISTSSTVAHMPIANLAVQYIRLSAKTLDQRHSYANQSAVISEFAKAHGLKIIRTYLDDDSASNSKVARPAQKRLIEDLRSGRCDRVTILIYDISRLGHFSGSTWCTEFEQIAREAGIQIVCCDADASSDRIAVEEMMLFINRAMAAMRDR